MRNVVACVLLAIVLSGCGILSREPYHKVNYYDLSFPQTKHEIGDMRISVSGIEADRPYSNKMVFRVSENRLEMDDFNCWICSPSDLIGKYFIFALENSAKDGAKSCSLSAEILQMEADLDKSSVKLILQVSIRDSSSGDLLLDKTYSQVIPVEKVTGESYAKGVETAMDKTCVELSQDIQKIKK